MPKKTPRTFKRISYIALASVRMDILSPPHEAYVINFSFGGVALYSLIELSGQVEVTLFLEDDEGKKVQETLWGNVVWEKNIGSMHAYGIEFGNLNPQDHQVTMSLMEQLLT